MSQLNGKHLEKIDKTSIEDAVTTLLKAIGEDPTRDGLQHTPSRVARMYEETMSGYRTSTTDVINGAIFDIKCNDMVIVRDINFFSTCEHHLVTFSGRVHVAYIPKGKVIGLSKIPRIVEMFSRRLQVQERLTAEIAHFLMDAVDADGVAVVADASHLCATMRGVKSGDARMMTSSMLGDFRDDASLRAEFLNSLQRGSRTVTLS